MDYIEQQTIEFPEFAAEYRELGSLYDSKLWHQLSEKLEFLFRNNAHFQGVIALSFYDKVLAGVENRFNPVKMAVLTSLIGRTQTNPEDAMRLYERALTNKEKMDADAVLCLEMDIVLLNIRFKELEKAKAKLEEYQSIINNKKSSEAIVFSKYYRALAEFKKVVGPAHEFYAAGIQFLSFTPVEELAVDDRQQLARDMAIAALTSEEIYHFGEVLATPILNTLRGTPDEWIFQLVQTVNAGDVSQFRILVKAPVYQQTFGQYEIIQLKTTILAAVNLIFERPAHSRIINFADLAAVAVVPLDQVEWLLMKVMALGLIKGSIDEVNATVTVSWVQPRVLTIPQLSALNEQLGIWSEKVKTAVLTIEDQAAELFVG